MHLKKIIILGLLLGAPITPVISQPIQPVVANPNTGETYLRAGTPIALTMSEELSTKGKNLRVGYRFRMQVSEPVMINNVVVIPEGSPAIGEVTDVRNKGMWGKSGKINARILHVTVNGRMIRLTGQIDDKGVTGTAGVVGAIAFVPIAGFFTTGTSAKIPMGAPVPAFIDEDVPVILPKDSYQSKPQPLIAQEQPRQQAIEVQREQPVQSQSQKTKSKAIIQE
jgi:hypothetical protein